MAVQLPCTDDQNTGLSVGTEFFWTSGNHGPPGSDREHHYYGYLKNFDATDRTVSHVADADSRAEISGTGATKSGRLGA